MIRAVVLDMDGVMIDTEPMYQHAWQRACGELGFILDDEGYAALVGRPTADCEDELVTRFGPQFPMSLFRASWPPPRDCAAVEDSDAGVLAASSAGMMTLCVPDSKPPSPTAVAAAFRVLRSLDDVHELLTHTLAVGG